MFSEEGFLTITDLARSEKAVRLRKWIRRHFRVKQQGEGIIVAPKDLPRDDFSDLGEDGKRLQWMSALVMEMAENQRRLRDLGQRQQALQDMQHETKAEAKEIKAKVKANAKKIQALEKNVKLQQGEMTAVAVANKCGWCSASGAPHNMAVILAAVNNEYIEHGWLVKRPEEGPNRIVVEVTVLTVEGVAKFMSELDAIRTPGQRFTIAPNDVAKRHGHNRKAHVYKAAKSPLSLPLSSAQRGHKSVK